MKHLIFMVILLSGCISNSKLDATSSNVINDMSATDSNIPDGINVTNVKVYDSPESKVREIFKYVPQEESALISSSAYEEYFNTFKEEVGFKSFAQSENGAWGYSINQVSQNSANQNAVSKCEKNNKAFKSYPCVVINETGSWKEQSNRALEILNGLPKFVPDDTFGHKEIIQSAANDMYSQNYALALAKTVWLYQAQFDKSMRIGFGNKPFGFTHWKYLSKQYPPAKTLLRYISNYTKIKIVEGNEESPHLALNFFGATRALNRKDKAFELIKWLDLNDVKKFNRYFPIFKDVLIDLGEFALYGKHLNSEEEYFGLLMSYENQRLSILFRDFPTEEDREWALNTIQEFITLDIARLVASLTKNGRVEEAKTIAKKAEANFQFEELNDLLKQALLGNIPKLN
ncbi:hypothetical protein [Paraglaciecola sp. L3A3]|uniref:hypothetical protein n=1 Tax=Paraglaciecola sp. L3A3 TaxID=2686358 RepID=UPI00131CE42F|nr:hypothetical protein [Paraglaciecola sp. L3A3]